MNRVSGFVIAGLVLVLGVTPSWGVPPNPTPSDSDGNTAGGTNALANVTRYVTTRYTTILCKARLI